MNSCNDARRWYLRNIQVMNKMTNSTSKYGLGFMQYCILEAISSSKSITPANLAEELGMANSSVSRAIKRMNSMNLIVRMTSEYDDTRKVKLKITSDGKRVIDKINQELDQEFSNYFCENQDAID